MEKKQLILSYLYNLFIFFFFSSFAVVLCRFLQRTKEKRLCLFISCFLFLFGPNFFLADWTTPLSSPCTDEHNFLKNNISQELQSSNLLEFSPDLNNDASLQALTIRLQSKLRAAKSEHLAYTEVLLPSNLLEKVAAEMIVMSEKEPCGIRGCTIYIEFEDEPSNLKWVFPSFDLILFSIKLRVSRTNESSRTKSFPSYDKSNCVRARACECTGERGPECACLQLSCFSGFSLFAKMASIHTRCKRELWCVEEIQK